MRSRVRSVWHWMCDCPKKNRLAAPQSYGPGSLSLWRQDLHRVGEVQVENSHPHGKTCTHNSKPLARNQLRIRCRCLLWRQDLHRVGEVQVENSHPQDSARWKTCTHKKPRARLSFPVATRFHRVGEVQVENLHPQDSARWKTCTHKRLGVAFRKDGATGRGQAYACHGKRGRRYSLNSSSTLPCP